MKIPEIYLKGKKDPGLIDFMDYASIILNQGLYQMRTINTVPDWVANEGESLLYSSGGVRRNYYYIDAGWRYIQWSTSAPIVSGKIIDADGDTQVQVEESTDEDIIRFDAAGTEVVTIDVNELALISGMRLVFDGEDGDTYFTYNTNVLELYSDATKIVTADTDQFGVESGIKLGLEGNAGDTYWKYNSTSAYLEGYVNGTKRIEL